MHRSAPLTSARRGTSPCGVRLLVVASAVSVDERSMFVFQLVHAHHSTIDDDDDHISTALDTRTEYTQSLTSTYIRSLAQTQLALVYVSWREILS